MTPRPLRILHVGTVETGGGAASVAGNLVRGCRARGCQAWMAVGRRSSDDPNVFALSDDDRLAYRLSGYTSLQTQLGRLAGRSPGRGWGWVSRTLRLATHSRALAARWRGTEDFDFPGTCRLLDVPPARPDIVHCHNLHGGYFDLRALRRLSRQVPTVLTLHDAWLLSGHCAHSFDCDRWTTGCGECPDLSIYPAIRRDATAANWRRKREIYAGSRLHVATPSSWLMRRVERSMLAPAIRDACVIPNGVDLSVFHPADQPSVRRALGIAPDAAMVLLPAGRPDSPWHDREMLRAAVGAVAARTPGRGLLLVTVGDGSEACGVADTLVRRVPSQADPRAMAQYYQAADVYVHAARAATFPSTILEALACGTPVVAAEVGGIPEQIQSTRTGLLVAAQDSGAMADAVVGLLSDGELRHRLGEHAAGDARVRFDLQQQVDRYLAWYGTIIEHWSKDATAGCDSTPASAAG